LEIASCTGNIVLDEKDEIVVHAHMVVSDKECKTFGGHLMKGSEIGATAESVMVEAAGVDIHKVYDEKTQLKLWRLS
jgi:predicted DNA-binding protein with PD1-like motif